MEPEEAFRLIDPRGIKNRAVATNESPEQVDVEDLMTDKPTDSPKWLRYSIICISVILSLGFIALVARGVYLIYDKNEPIEKQAPEEEALVIFSEEEIHQQIEKILKAFLDCTSTRERLQYVLSPNLEETAMRDYYDKRGNLDTALWKIRMIKSTNLSQRQLWMVAYYDVKKRLRYARFERDGNRFLIQWSSSYAYGEMPWSEFISTEPDGPVAMRCYIIRQNAELPPGIDPSKYLGFVIENKRGEVTRFATMAKAAPGALLLSRLPIKTRNPVHLRLGYIDLPNGIRQLTILELIHFQWHQHTMGNKGQPVIEK
ncbi:MAG: hypothetical protein KJO79_06175 [Verrucomicrobiae bacterium]|nr:hypothetical protein [Verrucomicrobiae bacterium]NNJ86748.1 hypothetical protein [Akkermansiaceae bacterium]